MERKEGWCFQAEHVGGVDNRIADGTTRWKREEIKKNLTKESPQTVWHARAGQGGAADVFGDFAIGYAVGRVAASTRKTYEANWRVWVSWRTYAQKGIRLDPDMEQAEMV